MPIRNGQRMRDPLKDGSKRDCTLTVWVSKKQRDKFDVIAKRNGMSRARLIAKAIGPGLRELRDRKIIH